MWLLFCFGQFACAVARYSREIMDANGSPVSFSADLCGCEALAGLTAAEVEELFVGALDRAGATIVRSVSHAFPHAGLTCVLILSESHAVLHTWPETGTINIDIFSCTTRLQSLRAIRELGQTLGARHLSIQEIARADGHGPRTDAGT
jgi:S-adenosylmethionine decarboxylase proenzyme